MFKRGVRVDDSSDDIMKDDIFRFSTVASGWFRHMSDLAVFSLSGLVWVWVSERVSWWPGGCWVDEWAGRMIERVGEWFWESSWVDEYRMAVKIEDEREKAWWQQNKNYTWRVKQKHIKAIGNKTSNPSNLQESWLNIVQRDNGSLRPF